MKCVETLRRKGYRVTPQRLVVLAAIQSSEDHISADEIYAQVQSKYPRMNISTVYRTLELLTELGLVTQTNLGENRLYYHFADKGQHHHLICQKCGRVSNIDEALLTPFKEALFRQYRFSTELRHLAVFGRCARCS